VEPDARVKKGFRIGIAAAAKLVASYENGGGWHNVLAAEIRDLTPVPDARDRLIAVLTEITPHGLGGYGDFAPDGGWDAWEDRYEAALAAAGSAG